MKAIQTTISLCIAVFLAACSPTLPSESDARSKVEQQIQNYSHGLIRLLSFEKTNGVRQEGMGMYYIEYTAEIEFLDDCMWTSKPFFWATPGIRERESGGFNDEQKPGKKGEHRKTTGAVRFTKTEKGWQPDK